MKLEDAIAERKQMFADFSARKKEAAKEHREMADLVEQKFAVEDWVARWVA
jgi:hypothetical protein